MQWRRNSMSLTRMRRASYGPTDYVMDSAPFLEDELKEEQERQQKLLAEGKEVVKFVRNHGTVLACYRKCPNFTELEMYNETRFTTEVTMIRSMIKNCNHLEGAIIALR